MATWTELSQEALQAAKKLAGQGLWRSSINRSYYAAYCAVSGELVKRRVNFARGWQNPAHEQLPDLIENNLALPQTTRRRLKRIVRVLRKAREDADYRPGIVVNRALALDRLRDALTVMNELGLKV